MCEFMYVHGIIIIFSFYNNAFNEQYDIFMTKN